MSACPTPAESGGSWCIAVHSGAGFHSHRSEQRVHTALNKALEAGGTILREGGDCEAALVAAIAALEADTSTNAGKGSNLTEAGTVECDAAVMHSSDGAFGSVAAVSGLQSPISGAAAVAAGWREGPRSLGRTPPVMLCGAGAVDYCVGRGVARAEEGGLVTPQQRSRWRRAGFGDAAEASDTGTPATTSTTTTAAAAATSTSIPSTGSFERGGSPYIPNIDVGPTPSHSPYHTVDSPMSEAQDELVEAPTTTTTTSTSNHAPQDEDMLMDTVGAVVLDSAGNVSAGVSSGGIAFKLPGRVGEAAVFGAGCYAEARSGVAVGVSATGNGESLIRAQLASAVNTRLHAAAIASAAAECDGGDGEERVCDGDGGEDPATVLSGVVGERVVDANAGAWGGASGSEALRYAGALGLVGYGEEGCEVVFAHSTPTMAVGVLGCRDSVSKTWVSRMDDSNQPGSSVVAQGLWKSFR